jgi:16S rRNA (cytosine967-C5)-methyltransferase
MSRSGKQKPQSDPRALAWRVLQRVEQGGYADILLGQALSRAVLAPADRALAVRLVYGTLAWQLYLDHLLAGFCVRPLAELDPPIRVLLRMAMFQLCQLQRVPAFAAVDTAVELAKSYKHGAAVGLVNAVLRRAATGWQGVPLPARDRDPAGYLSVRYSHPRWLVERWLAELGQEQTEALLRANNEPAPTTLRVNCMRAKREEVLEALRRDGLHGVPGSFSPAAIVIGGFDPASHPLYQNGRYSVQGEAAQLVSYLVAPNPGERVLDLCAAPGGKSLHLAELMNNQGEVVAVDTQQKGLAQLRAEARRLGISIVKAVLADARGWSDPAGLFDRVLLDAPCSGLGTLRQHPEIRWRRSPESIEQLAVLQRELLEAASRHVRPGGVLVYATCTIVRAENDEVVEDFLGKHCDFVRESPPPEPVIPWAAVIDRHGALRTFPHQHGLDGFFGVRLRRV